MKTIDVLLLADDKPGHYHLSEGVIAALECIAEVQLTRVDITRRRWMPGRWLARMTKHNISPGIILGLGYGLKPSALSSADLIISAGGNTLAANIAASRTLDAHNIFIGSLRRFSPLDFSLVITSYQNLAHLPRHLAMLKPGTMDPDKLGRPGEVPRFSLENPPEFAGLLLGGKTPDHKFEVSEWRDILLFVEQSHTQWGTKWLISNSRRTPDSISNLFAKATADSSAIENFTDVRKQGTGTLSDIFRTADIILCTDDSSSMISEAISARLPVIGISPRINGFTKNENEYRRLLHSSNWTRTLPIENLNVDNLAATLAELSPMKHNHIKVLAEKLKARLPELFE